VACAQQLCAAAQSCTELHTPISMPMAVSTLLLSTPAPIYLNSGTRLSQYGTMECPQGHLLQLCSVQQCSILQLKASKVTRLLRLWRDASLSEMHSSTTATSGTATSSDKKIKLGRDIVEDYKTVAIGQSAYFTGVALHALQATFCCFAIRNIHPGCAHVWQVLLGAGTLVSTCFSQPLVTSRHMQARWCPPASFSCGLRARCWALW
jgi:hypothetical protein